MNILFLDDDTLSHFCLNLALKKTKYPFNFYKLKSPLKALSILKQRDFDCIITDYNMPELTGLQFIKELNNIKTSKPPVIGYTSENTRISEFKQHDLVIKVFDKSKLIECLDYIFINLYPKAIQ